MLAGLGWRGDYQHHPPYLMKVGERRATALTLLFLNKLNVDKGTLFQRQVQGVVCLDGLWISLRPRVAAKVLPLSPPPIWQSPYDREPGSVRDHIVWTNPYTAPSPTDYACSGELNRWHWWVMIELLLLH